MQYEFILKEIEEEIQPWIKEGKVADYIPALAQVDPNQFAMSIHLLDGQSYHIGNSDHKFSIQSISKVFSFAHIMGVTGGDLENRLGLEPSGSAFNSLVQLEYENGIPRNPFINAGAIVVADMLVSKYKENTFSKMLEYIREIDSNCMIDFDKDVYVSEKSSGHRNYSVIELMKSFGNIKNNINDVMDVYFKLCSITMSTEELSRAMLFFS